MKILQNLCQDKTHHSASIGVSRIEWFFRPSPWIYSSDLRIQRMFGFRCVTALSASDFWCGYDKITLGTRLIGFCSVWALQKSQNVRKCSIKKQDPLVTPKTEKLYYILYKSDFCMGSPRWRLWTQFAYRYLEKLCTVTEGKSIKMDSGRAENQLSRSDNWFPALPESIFDRFSLRYSA